MTNINRNIILLLIIITTISIGYAYPYIGLTTIFDSGGASTLQGNVTVNDTNGIVSTKISTLQGNTIINDSGIVSNGKNLTNLCTGAFTYCIQNENGIITATNGSTGNIDYSGVSHDTIFRNVLMNNNGSVFVKRGTYNYLGTVRVQFGKSDTSLTCEPGTKITFDVDNVAFAISANLKNVTIQGCIFESMFSGTLTDNYIMDTGANLQNIFIIENTFYGYRTPGRPLSMILNFGDDGGVNYHNNIHIEKNKFINKNTSYIDASIAGISIKYFNGLFVKDNEWYNINNDIMPATVTPKTNYNVVYSGNRKYQTSNKTDGEGPDIATTDGIEYKDNWQFTSIANGSVDTGVSFGGLGGDQAATYRNFVFSGNHFNCTNNGISMATTWINGIISNNIFDNIGQCGGAGQDFDIAFDPSGIFTNITIFGNAHNNSLGTFRIDNGESKTNVKIDDKYYKGYNFGVLATLPTATSADQYYTNSSKSVPNTCQSTAAGIGGWVFANNGTVGC